MHPILPLGTPLVWRTATTLQVGFSVALSDAPRGAQAALRLLDGSMGVAEAARFSRVDLGWLQQAVVELDRAGVLDNRAAGHVAIAGEGAAADAVRDLLAGRHRVAAYDPASPWRAPDVVVVAPAHAGPDRALTTSLLRAGIPHLLLAPVPRGMTVGPFVLPGREPCQRCCDLTLTGRDREWPRIAAQLASTRPGADPVAVAWAAGLAAAHVETFLAGGVPQSAGRSWELCAGELAVRRWPRHPDCECALAVA